MWREEVAVDVYNGWPFIINMLTTYPFIINISSKEKRVLLRSPLTDSSTVLHRAAKRRCSVRLLQPAGRQAASPHHRSPAGLVHARART
jgi:hypothetical protein